MALTESFVIPSQVACKKLLKELGSRIILGKMVSCHHHLMGFLFIAWNRINRSMVVRNSMLLQCGRCRACDDLSVLILDEQLGNIRDMLINFSCHGFDILDTEPLVWKLTLKLS